MGFIMNAKQLFKQLDKCLNECFLWPNDILPEEFQDNRSDYVSQADIIRKCDERDGTQWISAEQEDATERASRVQAYAAQIAEGKEISYIPR